MKVVLVEPVPRHAARGNSVTAARWARGLGGLGVEVVPAAPDDLAGLDLGRLGPHLVHAHHAVHCGPAAAAAARRAGVPLVVSLGGTDVHGAAGPEAAAALAQAAVVVGPFAAYGSALAASLGRPVPYLTVRRGVDPAPLGLPPAGDKDLGLLGVGGLRPVKGQLRAVALARALRDRGLGLRLTLAGPALDPAYGARVVEALEADRLGRWVGEVPREGMGELYARADCLLNGSENEGASNAILEAWAGGLPVAARDAPGNRELLAPAPRAAACLFGDGEAGLDALAAWLRELAVEAPGERLARARAAQAHARAAHAAEDEARELLAAYRLALGRVSAP